MTAIVIGNGISRKLFNDKYFENVDYVIECHEATHPQTNVVVSTDYGLKMINFLDKQIHNRTYPYDIYYGITSPSDCKKIMSRHQSFIQYLDIPIIIFSGTLAIQVAIERLSCHTIYVIGMDLNYSSLEWYAPPATNEYISKIIYRNSPRKVPRLYSCCESPLLTNGIKPPTTTDVVQQRLPPPKIPDYYFYPIIDDETVRNELNCRSSKLFDHCLF